MNGELKDVLLGECKAWDFVNSRGDTICGRYYLPPPLPVISEALFGTVPIRRGPVLGDGGHLHMDNATKLEWCKDFPKLAKRIKPIVS